MLSGQALGWVEEYKYLGFPTYAYNNTPRNLPVNLSVLNEVLLPLAHTLLPSSAGDFFLASRADILAAMAGGKVLRNAPAAGVTYSGVGAKVSRWLGSIAGLPANTTSATFLRCELGVLPSQLVAERNALYYLWHLRNETWYKHFLPSLQHLAPISRLTGLLLDNNITLEEFRQHAGPAKGRKTAKEAVLKRAQSWHDDSAMKARIPSPGFVCRGRPHLREDPLAEVATTAAQARAGRLPGVPNAWEYHSCPFCGQDSGLNGIHLLQREELPRSLLVARDELLSSRPVGEFASEVISCKPNEFTKRGLCLADRVFRATRRAIRGSSPPGSPQPDVAGEEFLV